MNIRSYLDKFLNYMRNLFKYNPTTKLEYDSDFGRTMRD